jgi:hypothetical protein
MFAVSRPARLVFAALAVPLLISTCKSSTEAASVATAIDITPSPATLTAIGMTLQFTAVVKDQRGQTMSGAVVSWASTNPAVVTVESSTGLATAVANGGARVTATSGTLTQNANVTVAQAAAQIVRISGNAQSATVGKALAQPLVVQVNDVTSHAIAGATVTFAVTGGGGSVGTPSATAGANGQAQTTWTLGPAAGAQGVSASVTGVALPLAFSATANPGSAKSVAKQAGDGQSTTTGATVTTAPAVVVRDTFNNPVPGVAVTFSVPAGSGSITGANQATNASGVAAVGSWTLGNVGTDTLTATVTGSGIAGNPVTFTASSMAIGTPTQVFVYAGNNGPGLVGYGTNIRPAVRVLDAGNNPVGSATVTFAVTAGGGSVTGGVTTTNGNGIAQVGKWTLGGSPGVNTLSATVSGTGITGNPVTFADTGLAATYPITVQFFGPTPSAAVTAAMDSAAAKWQRLVYRQLTAVNLNLAAKTACGDTTAPAISTTTTGVLILAKFDSIDGPGKILGQAGPCNIRSGSGLTVLGEMEFDTADVAGLIAGGQLNEVMLHEMGHVLGFGTLWNTSPNAWLQQASNPPGTILDTYFNGPRGLAAFDSIGGTSYTGASLSPPGGNKVPVENCGASSPSGCGSGTVNGHWREPVFGNELMTGYINAGVNPLSFMSVAAQEDLGYTVNYDAADAYVHTFTAPVAGGAAPLFLGNDIRRGPIYVVDALGRVVGVR